MSCGQQFSRIDTGVSMEDLILNVSGVGDKSI